MAKNSLFRKVLFGFAKEDVNRYIAAQDRRVRELSASLEALEEKFEAHRRFYEALMRVYEENLTVLREVQIRAAKNEETVRRLSGIFGSLADSYQSLYQIALEQQAAIVTAKLYEEKATKYDALALQMKELVLPESMRTATEALRPLPAVGELPEQQDVFTLTEQADGALREMLADAKAFFTASARLQNPAPPEAQTQNAG